MRDGIRANALCIAAALAACLATTTVRAGDATREAAANLDAYAHYKAGRHAVARSAWEALAARGNTTALYNLSLMFEFGQGVAEDRGRALDYIAKAAELGDRRSQYELGLAYEKGDVLGRDIAKAAEWLKRSAENNYVPGQLAYGVLLATGLGKGRDKATDAERAEALDWLRKAAAKGNAEAVDYVKVLEGSG